MGNRDRLSITSFVNVNSRQIHHHQKQRAVLCLRELVKLLWFSFSFEPPFLRRTLLKKAVIGFEISEENA